MLKWLIENIGVDEKEKWVAETNRKFYKWVLDFLRNFMMVAALVYVAKKSASNLVWGIAVVAVFTLGGYCYTYADMIAIKGDSPRTWRNFAIWTVVFLAVQFSMFALTASMTVAIDRIVKAQMQDPKK